MRRKNIRGLLEGGDRRSIGGADQVAAAVSKHQALFPELMQGWWSEDPLVRMRTADATEKITRKNPHLLRSYEDVSKMPEPIAVLLKRGYSDSDLKKILGENTLRVVCEVTGEYAPAARDCFYEVGVVAARLALFSQGRRAFCIRVA